MSNFYVAPWGNNGAAGTSPSTPWLTINFAAAQLSPGDTLFGRQNQDGTPGYFNEQLGNVFPTGTSINPINFKNYPGETVWVKSPYTGDIQSIVIEFLGTIQYIVLDGINIDASLGRSYGIVTQDSTNHITYTNAIIVGNRLPGDTSTSTQSMNVRTNSHHNTFSNVTVYGWGGSNYNYGVYCHGADNIWDSCDISDVGNAGFQFYDFSGQANRNIVRYCKIHDITQGADGRRNGILFLGDANEIYYNLIYNLTGSQAIGITFYNSPTNSHVYNNTVYNCTLYGYALEGASNNLFKNNIGYNNGTNVFGSGPTQANNLTDGTNPLFVSSSTGNFQLTGASVAINTGVNVGLTRDLLGITVPQQTNPCIGCYEFVPTVPTPTPPNAPSGLSATTISSSQINLAWVNNGAATLVFKIERRIGNNAFTQIIQTAAGATTYNNTGLQSNTTYEYRVRAFDGSLNSNYSASASATTSINFPAAPSALMLTVISSSEIDASWTNNGPGTLRFSLERRIGTNAFQEIILTLPGVVTYNNIGLGSSTTYEYRVRSFDGTFYSTYSSTATATTSAAPPTPDPPPSPQPLPINVRWQVIFSKPVSGVNSAQFELSGTPVNSTIVSVVPQFTGTYGTVFIVTARLGPGTGTIGLNLKATGNIKDKAGNVLTVAFPGQVYIVTV